MNENEKKNLELNDISNKYTIMQAISTSIPHNPQSTELFNLNFQSLEVVSRYRDPQLQVTENLCYRVFVKFKSQHISVFQN